MSDLPHVIHEGALKISGVTLRTYVLSNGRRIVNADDVASLLKAWEQGAEMTPDDTAAMAAWCRETPAAGHA